MWASWGAFMCFFELDTGKVDLQEECNQKPSGLNA